MCFTLPSTTRWQFKCLVSGHRVLVKQILILCSEQLNMMSTHFDARKCVELL